MHFCHYQPDPEQHYDLQWGLEGFHHLCLNHHDQKNVSIAEKSSCNKVGLDIRLRDGSKRGLRLCCSSSWHVIQTISTQLFNYRRLTKTCISRSFFKTNETRLNAYSFTHFLILLFFNSSQHPYSKWGASHALHQFGHCCCSRCFTFLTRCKSCSIIRFNIISILGVALVGGSSLTLKENMYLSMPGSQGQ